MIIIALCVLCCGPLCCYFTTLWLLLVCACVCVAWVYFKLEHYVLNLPLVALLLPLLLLLLATLNLYWLRPKGNVGHKKQFILEFRLPTVPVCVCMGGMGAWLFLIACQICGEHRPNKFL